jgi:outer membrane protein
MKNNALLIWNIALTLLVGFLLVKQFSGPKPAGAGTAAASVQEGAPLRIAFVRADTLLAKFDEFRMKQEELEAKEIDLDGKIGTRVRALEQEIGAFQQKAQQGLLTPNQMADEEKRLMGKQQRLMEDREKLANELMSETQTLNKQLEERIKAVLTAVRDEFGYDYILSYGPGTGLLMANDSLDVTEEVLGRLNAKE